MSSRGAATVAAMTTNLTPPTAAVLRPRFVLAECELALWDRVDELGWEPVAEQVHALRLAAPRLDGLALPAGQVFALGWWPQALGEALQTLARESGALVVEADRRCAWPVAVELEGWLDRDRLVLRVRGHGPRRGVLPLFGEQLDAPPLPAEVGRSAAWPSDDGLALEAWARRLPAQVLELVVPLEAVALLRRLGTLGGRRYTVLASRAPASAAERAALHRAQRVIAGDAAVAEACRRCIVAPVELAPA